MKNKKRRFGKLKLHKHVISTFSTTIVTGGGTSNVKPTRCIDCPSNNPDLACEDTKNPHHNHGTGHNGTVFEISTPDAGCVNNTAPDMTC